MVLVVLSNDTYRIAARNSGCRKRDEDDEQIPKEGVTSLVSG